MTKPVTKLPQSRALPAQYLTPSDIAELFRVPLETVYRWRKQRTGPPAFRVGKHLRYDPQAVADYVRTLNHPDIAA